MKLTSEQQEILDGKQGPVMAKIMETVVMFGDIFDAPRLVKVTHDDGHLVTSFGIKLLKPLFSTMPFVAVAPSTRTSISTWISLTKDRTTTGNDRLW